MRLLNSTTLELHEFIGAIPPYAILSHPWGQDEVSFQVMGAEEAKSKQGFQKIKSCCVAANADGFEWVWVDTCCIDKTSSAELSEAINSMYRWYQEAQVCFVYLADVHVSAGNEMFERQFRDSRWFTRGWTLQELIAPHSLIFIDSNWRELGTKKSLTPLMQFTGIHEDALHGADLDSFSVAQRMSWASQRITTREEDLAYCLMGLFHVNMPMLYGEGRRAFIRLQEEIIRTSDDHSIFAWHHHLDLHVPFGIHAGLLALHVVAFRRSGNVVRSNGSAAVPYTLTNKGVQLYVPLVEQRVEDNMTQDHVLAVLESHSIDQPSDLLAIPLIRLPGRFDYARTNQPLVCVEKTFCDAADQKVVFVKQKNQISRYQNSTYILDTHDRIVYCECCVRIASHQQHEIEFVNAYPYTLISRHGTGLSTYLAGRALDIVAVMELRSHDQTFFLCLRIKEDMLLGGIVVRGKMSLSEAISLNRCLGDLPLAGWQADCPPGSDRLLHMIEGRSGGVSVSIRKTRHERQAVRFAIDVCWANEVDKNVPERLLGHELDEH